MSDGFWERLVQGEPLVPERWRWVFALPWFLLGLASLWIWAAFAQGAPSTSHASWFALMTELSTWVGAIYIFAWFVFPRDLFPHAARAKPQGPSKPLRS